jgi:hypothetical protein
MVPDVVAVRLLQHGDARVVVDRYDPYWHPPEKLPHNRGMTQRSERNVVRVEARVRYRSPKQPGVI